MANERESQDRFPLIRNVLQKSEPKGIARLLRRFKEQKSQEQEQEPLPYYYAVRTDQPQTPKQ